MTLRAHFIFFVALIGIAPVLLAQSAPVGKQRMMQVVQNYVDNNTFMGDVLVAKGDQIVLKAAYGYADLDWSIENTDDAKFRIGIVDSLICGISSALKQIITQVRL